MHPVVTESTRGRKFAQPMPNHVFRNVNRNKNLAVVNSDSHPHEFRADLAGTPPGFNRFLTSALPHFLNLL